MGEMEGGRERGREGREGERMETAFLQGGREDGRTEGTSGKQGGSE